MTTATIPREAHELRSEEARGNSGSCIECLNINRMSIAAYSSTCHF